MSAAALPFISMGLQAVSTIAGGIGANAEARAGARIDDENARLSLLAGEQQAGEVLRQERMAAGEAVVSMADAGGGLGWGTAADVLAESLANRDRDIAALRTKAAGEARNHMRAAADKRSAGRAALIGAAFNTVAGALGNYAAIKGQARIGAAVDRVRRGILNRSVAKPVLGGSSYGGGGLRPTPFLPVGD